MIKQLLQYKRSNKVTSSGSHGAVAQLDDTGRGMSGNIRYPEGCLWKNNNNPILDVIGISKKHRDHLGIM
jgi:hypothetical protein